MNANIVIQRYYPHPPEKVWRALTQRELLAKWLMENDFEAVLGRDFTFHFCEPDDETKSAVACRVLEMEPPSRLVWAWRNEGEAHETRVEWSLRPENGGTRLTLRHIGEVSDERGEQLEAGWPVKLEQLSEMLEKQDGDA